MARLKLMATTLVVFGVTSLTATAFAPTQHAPMASPAYVLSIGGAVAERSVPISPLSAPVLHLVGRAALSCQTVLTLGGLRVGRDCAPTPLATALAD